ncbi:MAG: thiol-disulfide oxidoreductase DCC family protein [Cytophagaceae bacterium]
MTKPDRIILFDGICNLCDGFVIFILQRDRMKRFKFLSLQSDRAASVLEEYGLENQINSIVLIDNGKAYTKSTAALRIFKGLNKGWPLLYVLIIVPKPLRDFIYKFVAKNRYRWFGKKEACLLPDSKWKEHFY